MKKICFLCTLLILCGLSWAEAAEPVAEILDLMALVSVDSLMAHVQHLQDYQTRYALHENHQEIAGWIQGKFASYGYSDAWLQAYPWQGTTQYNVIATLEGYMYPGIQIILGAHYDSQNPQTGHMIFAPGADDNASGTAGLLEIARVMKQTGYQPRATIRFVAFSAEEVNGMGSQAYCAYAISANHNIRLMINMDMLGSNDPPGTQYLVVPPSSEAEEYSAELIRIAQSYSAYQPVLGTENLGSDSYIFALNGFNAAMIIERHLSPYWHTGNDLIEYLDFQYCLELVRSALAATAVFANQPLPVGELCLYDTGTGNSLLAEWDSPPDPSVTQYKVYYGIQPDAMLLAQTVSGNQCVVSGLEDGQRYYIAVAAVNAAGYSSMRIYREATPQSVPRIPQLLEDHPGRAAITITWQANQELDMSSYGVHRQLGSQGSPGLIATVAFPQTSFTDRLVESTEEYYYYSITAIDAQGNQSPASAALRSRIVSLDRGILVVDESRNSGGSSPFQPTDVAVDGFYARLLDGFTEIDELDLEEQTGCLKLADIGVYSSLLWHGNDNAEFDYPHQIRDALRQYINLGGKAMFSLYFPSMALELNAGYPAVFDSGSVICQALGIQGADYSVGARFKYALPLSPGFPALQVDSLKTLAAWQGHIFGVEVLLPVDPGDSVYGYGSDYEPDSGQGVLNGGCVGLHHQYGAGQVLCLSFPLYNMQEAAAQTLVEHVFGELFAENTAAASISVPAVPGIRLSSAHPNPFRAQTGFRVETDDTISPLSVDVYNLRGQKLANLFTGRPPSNAEFVWDGRDAAGKPAGSGIYIIRAASAKHTAQVKILKLN